MCQSAVYPAPLQRCVSRSIPALGTTSFYLSIFHRVGNRVSTTVPSRLYLTTPMDTHSISWIHLVKRLFRQYTLPNHFLIAERLAVDFIVGTLFLNRHVIVILCGEKKVQFRTETVPIIILHRGRKDPDSFPGPSSKWVQARTRQFFGA